MSNATRHFRQSFLFVAAVAILTAPALSETAQQDYESGHFSKAALEWNQSARRFQNAGDAARASQALANQGAAEESIGDYAAAIDCLRKSVSLDGENQPGLKVALAQAYILARADSMGMSCLPEAQRLLDAVAHDLALRATVQATQGSLYLALDRPHEAAAAYQSSLKAAQAQGDRVMTARAAANAAVACLAEARNRADVLAAGDSSDQGLLTAAVSAGRGFNATAWEAAAALPQGHTTAFLLLTIGQSDEGLAVLGSSDIQLRLAAYAAYQQAIKAADPGDGMIRSYALGYTAHLYELDGRYDEAQRLTAQALFLAQQLSLPNLLYPWEWQTGRLLKAAGDRDGAISAYQAAAASLREIQTDLSAGGGNSPGGVTFRQAAGNIYYELADLLLRRAASNPPGEIQQADLAAARETVESLKTAELQNFFQSRCERLLEERRKSIERIDSHTAVVYFIPLPDRVEILVSVSEPGNKSLLIQQFASRITADELTKLARQFRVEVRDQSSEDYFADGQALYRWLIAPIEPYLSSRAGPIDTLVFVPDGALRSIPMAALVDEKGHFLIEKYAIAVSPGLRLTEARSDQQSASTAPRILISGLSIARGGFPALQNVPDEIRQINASYAGRSHILLNENFVASQMNSQLQSTDYSIVHIASHGHFGGDARDTYVLDFDGRLDLDDLERLIEPSKYRQRPVDLLTLSACETAAGDDRAALGLAGIAVKAGALSAMATLWSVNDRSSAALVPRFYAHLAEPGSTKAKALRAAQLELISSPQLAAYRHPYFWSPYLIVGNWL